MLKMRLQRYGRKNNPSYRVVVTDSRNSSKTGNHVDVIGAYEPKMGKFTIDGERAKHWISKGTQVSDTVYNFLITEKVIEGKKRNALSRKSPIIDEAKIKAEADAKATKEAKELADAEAKVAEEAAAKVKAESEAQPQEQAPDTVEETPAEETPVAEEAKEAVEVK